MSKAAEACGMPTLKAVKKNNGLGWQASQKKGEVRAIPLANYLPALEPEHDKSKEYGVLIANGKPVLVFDVNETLLDIDALMPLFEGIFGRGEAMREWFAQLVLYSQALSLAGRYAPFNVLGGAVLRMVGATHDLTISDDDVFALGAGIAALPLHTDVANALARLQDADFRLFTLTNSPADHQADPLRRAGVAGLFERRFTVDAVRRFKPAHETYAMVARELDLPAASMCMIAAHVWDTIGAQSAGWMAALVTRPGNAALPLTGLAQPDFVGPDLPSIAEQLLERWD